MGAHDNFLTPSPAKAAIGCQQAVTCTCLGRPVIGRADDERILDEVYFGSVLIRSSTGLLTFR